MRQWVSMTATYGLAESRGRADVMSIDAQLKELGCNRRNVCQPGAVPGGATDFCDHHYGAVAAFSRTKLAEAQILIPLATSIVFGLLASTVLVLLVVPSLYAILGDFKAKRGTDPV